MKKLQLKELLKQIKTINTSRNRLTRFENDKLNEFFYSNGITAEIADKYFSKFLGDLFTLKNLIRRVSAKDINLILKEDYFIEKKFSMKKEVYLRVKSFSESNKSTAFKSKFSDIFSRFKFTLSPIDLNGFERGKCPKCEKMKSLYCSGCILPVDNFKPPKIKLPVKLFVIYEPKSGRSKLTSLHAKILAPDCTEFHDFNDDNFLDQLDKFDRSETALLYPSKDSLPLETLIKNANNPAFKSSDQNDTFSIKNLKNLILIDSTWSKVNKVINSPILENLPKISLNVEKTLYWHSQRIGKTKLSSIEAIFYAMRELTALNGGEDSMDDLLLFFAKDYFLIKDQLSSNGRRVPMAWEVFPEGFLEMISVEE